MSMGNGILSLVFVLSVVTLKGYSLEDKTTGLLNPLKSKLLYTVCPEADPLLETRRALVSGHSWKESVASFSLQTMPGNSQFQFTIRVFCGMYGRVSQGRESNKVVW